MKTPNLHIQGNGTPFIWLHGMLNSVKADSIYSMVDFEMLSKIVSIVRYNTCDKSVKGDYSWDASTSELFRIIHKQHYKAMILGGCSMGAGTAIHAAVRYPDIVQALILVTPPPAWEMRAAIRTTYYKIAEKLEQDTIPDFLKRLIKQNNDIPEFYEQVHPGTREMFLEERLSFLPAYYPRIYLGGAMSDLPDRELISKINIPTLIIARPDDANHPLEIAQQLHNLIKGSELVTVKDFPEFLNLQEKLNNFILSVTSDNKS